MVPQEIKLIASTGRASGQAVEIRSNKFFIGRHDNCQIRPDVQRLAGIHALIEHRDNGYHLRDFGGEGGTGVNDRVIFSREVEVFDGDLIQIGPMVLTVSIKPRGVDTHRTLREIPEGWPFVADLPSELPIHDSPSIGSSSELRTSPGPPIESATSRIDFAKILKTPAYEPAEPENPAAGLSEFVTREAERARALAATAVLPSGTATPVTPTVGVPIRLKSKPFRAISCRDVEGVTVVTPLEADLNEEETVSPVRHELRTLLDEQAPSRTVLDLGQVRYLSSRAVGVFLAHYQAVDRQGGSLRLCAVASQVKPVLDQMRLSRLVDTYGTLEEALADSWE